MGETGAGRLRVLVVDDDATLRDFVCLVVRRQGHETTAAADALSAITHLNQERFHLVITDKNMPGTDHPDEGGLDVIRHAKRVNPGCAVLMMTSYATVESAIEAMQLGAFDYIAKPLDATKIWEKLERVRQYQQTVDPARAFAAHDGFRAEFIALLDDDTVGDCLDEAHKARLVAAMQEKIDDFFRERRAWERIIFEQREALTEIAGWAAQLQEALPPGAGAGELVSRIVSAAQARV